MRPRSRCSQPGKGTDITQIIPKSKYVITEGENETNCKRALQMDHKFDKLLRENLP